MVGKTSSLDLEFVRSQFPGLSRGWTFFDNAGGSQILKGAVRAHQHVPHREERADRRLLCRLAGCSQSAIRSSRRPPCIWSMRRGRKKSSSAASTTALLQNLARAMQSQLSPGDEIIVTISDHESNIGPWERLQERRYQPKVLAAQQGRHLRSIWPIWLR